MKKIRLSVLVFCIICLTVLAFSGTEKGNLEKKYHKMDHSAIAKDATMSILSQVHDYQNKLLMYRNMYFANPSVEKRAQGKIEGFLDKLKKGNNLQVDGKRDTSVFIEKLLDSNAKVWFEVKNICLNFNVLPPDASEYAIDGTADVTLVFNYEASPKETYDVTFSVDHMKRCIPD